MHKAREAFTATADGELRLYFALGCGSDLVCGQGDDFSGRFGRRHGSHNGVA